KTNPACSEFGRFGFDADCERNTTDAKQIGVEPKWRLPACRTVGQERRAHRFRTFASKIGKQRNGGNSRVRAVRRTRCWRWHRIRPGIAVVGKLQADDMIDQRNVRSSAVV